MCIVNATILPLLRPFHQSLEPLLKAYRVGLRAGDTEFAINSAMAYSLVYMCIGLPLGPLEPDVISFGKEAVQFGLSYSVVAMFEIFRQTILNLQTDVETPTVLCGDAMDQEKMLSNLEGNARAMTLRDISTFQLILACIYGDLDTAEKMFEASDLSSGSDMSLPRVHLRRTYHGLAAFMLGHRRGKKKYLALGRKIMKEVRSYVKLGSVNEHPILLMLEAEESLSIASYDAAIKACARSGLVHHVAYMNERAGIHLLEKNDEREAEFYLTRAMELYEDWGLSGASSNRRHIFKAASPNSHAR